jgi:hypothetical protein
MPNAISFLWNATRGHRMRPWRSEYVKWRIETYSGMKTETMTAAQIFQFAWKEKWALLRFLLWTGTIDGQQNH